MLKKSIYLLPLCALILVLNSCSSSHTFNDNFGLLENIEADKQLQKEELTSNEELQKFNEEVNTLTKFELEEGTFLAEDWIETEPVITYLYPYDPKFYSEDELPENKGRLGNVVDSL